MCNEYDRLRSLSAWTTEEFSRLAPLQWAGGLIPNVGEQPGIRIGTTAAIVRRADGEPEASMLPWAWKSPNGAPVFNFRSEGRSFAKSDRCLIPADAFYEFTNRTDGKKSPKHKHRFTMADGRPFWVAGLVKNEAFTMLTTAPGPDVAPIHDRQIIILPLGEGLAWLDLARPEAEVLRPLPAGTLAREQVA